MSIIINYRQDVNSRPSNIAQYMSEHIEAWWHIGKSSASYTGNVGTGVQIPARDGYYHMTSYKLTTNMSKLITRIHKIPCRLYLQ